MVRGSRETIVDTRSKAILGAGLTLVLAGALLSPVSAAYAANGTLSGTLTRGGEPAEGVLVGWFKPSTGTSKFVFTDADGKYSVGLPGAGAEYIVSVNATEENDDFDREVSTIPAVYYGKGDSRDFAHQKLTPYTSTGSDDTVNLTITEPATIHGASKAFAKSTVYLENQNGDYVDSDNTGSDGKYEFTYLVPGTYTVVGYDTKERTYLPWRHTTTVAAGQNKKLSSSSTLRRGGVVKGRITSGGKPVAGKYVTVTKAGALDSYWTDKTDKDGYYRISGFSSGSYNVQAGGPEETRSARYVHTSSRVTLTAGKSTKKNLALIKGGKIFATITGEGSSSYTEVYLKGAQNDTEAYFHLTGSGQRTLEVSGLASGSYRLVAVDSEGKSYSKKTVTVSAGKTSSLGSFSLSKKTITVKGTVSGGSSSGYRYVSITGATGYSVFDSANSAGKFTVKGVVPGASTISVAAKNREVRTYSATFTGSVSRAYTVGPAQGHVTGTFRLAGEPVDASLAWDAASGYYINPYVENGTLKAGYGDAGSYDHGEILIYNSFQSKSPYYVTLPSKAREFTLSNGKTTKLGTINLTVKG